MIRYRSEKQMIMKGFKTHIEIELLRNNRWVKMSQCIPWEALADSYYKSLSASQGRPAKDTHLVVGVVIIKHKRRLSDEETVDQIQNDFMDGGGRALSGRSVPRIKSPFLCRLT